MRELLALLQSVGAHRRLIWQLAVHDLRARYAATLAGAAWAILNPAAVIVVFWFVSVYGFRVPSGPDAPFFLVLFCGLVPWLTFNDALTGGAGAVLNNSYLVRKIAFPLEVLPVVNAVSAAIVHLFLLVLLAIIFLVSGIRLSPAAVQVAYFLAAMLAFTVGLAWTLAALNVIHRDVGQALGSVMTIWFWITPIVWPAQNLSSRALALVHLNPISYIVEGYRDSLLYGRPLGAHWPLDLYFWIVTAALFVLGSTVFRRLKPHFAEVL